MTQNGFILLIRVIKLKAMSIIDKYKRVRQYSVDMCKPLKTEDYIPQPAFFGSPPKWNLGHTTWFFEEMILKPRLANYKVFHPKFSFIFNSYYNTVGERVARDGRGDLSRPTVDEVYSYREYVDQEMHKLLTERKFSDDLHFMVELGLNHEEQHQELFFSDLKYAFSINPLFPAYNSQALCETPAGEEGWIDIPEGRYQIGYNEGGFCYDNEVPAHQVYLQAFQISKRLVSNGEFMDFIESGGYSNSNYWHDDAWAWLQKERISKPMYWHKIDNVWHQFTIAGLRKVNPDDAMCHISYYEAFAFAQYKGLRLPTEFEWEAAADHFEWGTRWEWTESAYLPYPGFKKATGAVGEYNGKFMVNQKVLRGASVATSAGHSRKTYRNFFHPQLGWQFNGIRLAR